MLNQVLTTIDSVKQAVQTAYAEQDWLVIALKHGGWMDRADAAESTVRINDLWVVATRDATAGVTQQLTRVVITVDFRVQGTDGWLHRIASLKHPTGADIRWELSRQAEYSGWQLGRPIIEWA